MDKLLEIATNRRLDDSPVTESTTATDVSHNFPSDDSMNNNNSSSIIINNFSNDNIINTHNTSEHQHINITSSSSSSYLKVDLELLRSLTMYLLQYTQYQFLYQDSSRQTSIPTSTSATIDDQKINVLSGGDVHVLLFVCPQHLSYAKKIGKTVEMMMMRVMMMMMMMMMMRVMMIVMMIVMMMMMRVMMMMMMMIK